MQKNQNSEFFEKNPAFFEYFFHTKKNQDQYKEVRNERPNIVMKNSIQVAVYSIANSSYYKTSKEMPVNENTFSPILKLKTKNKCFHYGCFHVNIPKFSEQTFYSTSLNNFFFIKVLLEWSEKSRVNWTLTTHLHLSHQIVNPYTLKDVRCTSFMSYWRFIVCPLDSRLNIRVNR